MPERNWKELTQMFYAQSDGHGLRNDPFKAIVAPRPIGWISTMNSRGIPNLAPYSFFNAFAARPHLIGFSSEGMKHSISNAKETGEFVFNLVSEQLLMAMNATSLVVDEDVSEFDIAQLEMAQSRLVRAPRVAAAPASLECKVVNFLELSDINAQPTGKYLIVGQVVGAHIKDEFIVDGRFDLGLVKPVVRCGYRDYSVIRDVFEVTPPAENAMQVL